MTQLQNSAFKTKAGSVADISKILPEPGAILLNELDGKIYMADQYGWGQMGTPFSPIRLFVEYDGVTQFDFKFKAPATSTLTFVDGDGTTTDVAGNDATEVTHSTTYAAAGTYFFYVVGDVYDLTYVSLSGETMASGDFNTFTLLPNLTFLKLFNTGFYGVIDNVNVLTNLDDLSFGKTRIGGNLEKLATNTPLLQLQVQISNVEGSVSHLKTLTNLTLLQAITNNITGEFSELATLVNLSLVRFEGTKIVFNKVVLFSLTGAAIQLQNCNLTSTMVDNALKSFVNLTGCTINLDGNNAKRTADSDAAYATVNAANTLTVNQ